MDRESLINCKKMVVLSGTRHFTHTTSAALTSALSCHGTDEVKAGIDEDGLTHQQREQNVHVLR